MAYHNSKNISYQNHLKYEASQQQQQEQQQQKKLKYEAKHRLKNKAPLYLNLLPKIFHIKTI